MSEKLLQEMHDYKQIVELKAKFVRTADAKDWNGYREVFGDDGVYDFGGGFTLHDGQAFVDAVAGQLEGAVSVHRAFLPVITFESPTKAKGEWAVNDYIEFQPDPTTGERAGFNGFGYEYETYQKIAGAWKITDWRVHYIRMDPLPRLPLPSHILGGPEVLRDKAYISGVTGRPY
jgi:hypothetical protein